MSRSPSPLIMLLSRHTGRRDFIAGLGSTLAWPRATRAQSLPVIGILEMQPVGAPLFENTVDPFRHGLAEIGFMEGRNVAIEISSADGHFERLPVLADNFARRKVALIFASSGVAAMAGKEATRTIPIVFFMGGDPVETGVVASLSRPGGNLTGVVSLAIEIVGKQLDLLRKLVPAASLIGVLSGPADIPYNQAESKTAQSAASLMGLSVLPLHAGADKETISAAFAALAQQKAAALLVGSSVTLNSARDQIISLAAGYAVPTMYGELSSVRAGGLMSYTNPPSDARRLAGVIAARILKGEKPADLPVQQSTLFQLAINLKTAKTLGLTVPPQLLAVADEVIE
jgi:putative tryptophan/tyrosine transport system substrate-binding protein